jgi:hypothetical protein
MSLYLGHHPVCEGEPTARIADGQWIVEVWPCGCSRTLGAYRGIGCRPTLHTVQCAAWERRCARCDRLVQDCDCGEDY